MGLSSGAGGSVRVSVRRIATGAAVGMYPVFTVLRALFSVAGMYLDLAVLARWLRLEAETGQQFYRTWFTVGICIFCVHFLVKFLNAVACTIYEPCFNVFGLSKRTRAHLALRTLVTFLNLEYGLQCLMTLQLWRESLQFGTEAVHPVSPPAETRDGRSGAATPSEEHAAPKRAAWGSAEPASKDTAADAWELSGRTPCRLSDGAYAGGSDISHAPPHAGGSDISHQPPYAGGSDISHQRSYAGGSEISHCPPYAGGSEISQQRSSNWPTIGSSAFYGSSASAGGSARPGGRMSFGGDTWQREYVDRFTTLNESFVLMRALDAVVKSAPQAILQVYVMCVTRQFTFLNMAAIACAIIAMMLMYIECTYSTVCGYGHFNVRPARIFSRAWFGSAGVALGFLCSRIAVFAMLATVSDSLLPLGVLVILSAFFNAGVLRAFCFDFLSEREANMMIAVEVPKGRIAECMQDTFLRRQARAYLVVAYSAAHWIIGIPSVVAGDTWKWRNRTLAPPLLFASKIAESFALWGILLFSTYVSGHRDPGMWPTTTPPCPVDGPRFGDPSCQGCCRGPVMRKEALTIFSVAHVLAIGGFGLWWPRQKRYFSSIPDLGTVPERPGQGLSTLSYTASGEPISWRPLPPDEYMLFRERAIPGKNYWDRCTASISYVAHLAITGVGAWLASALRSTYFGTGEEGDSGAHGSPPKPGMGMLLSTTKVAPIRQPVESHGTDGSDGAPRAGGGDSERTEGLDDGDDLPPLAGSRGAGSSFFFGTSRAVSFMNDDHDMEGGGRDPQGRMKVNPSPPPSSGGVTVRGVMMVAEGSDFFSSARYGSEIYPSARHSADKFAIATTTALARHGTEFYSSTLNSAGTPNTVDYYTVDGLRSGGYPSAPNGASTPQGSSYYSSTSHQSRVESLEPPREGGAQTTTEPS